MIEKGDVVIICRIGITVAKTGSHGDILVAHQPDTCVQIRLLNKTNFPAASD